MAPHDGIKQATCPHEISRVSRGEPARLAILSREISPMSHLGKPPSRHGVICNIRSDSG
jgi:hypothetical protein